MPKSTESIKEQISLLTGEMKTSGVDFCLLSNNDPNFSNSPDAHWRVLDWLLGFDDINASLIVGKDGKGYFFTDSRYELAMKEILKGTDIELRIAPSAESASLLFLCEISNFSASPLILALDDKTIRFSSFLSAEITKRPKIIFRPISFLDKVWQNRPDLKKYEIFDIENLVFPGTYERIHTPRNQKINKILAMINDMDSDSAILLSSSSDVAWALNIRSYDNVPSMLPPAFLILTHTTGYLFIQGRVDEKLIHDFNFLSKSANGIRSIKVFEYNDYFTKAHFFLPHGSSIFQISDASCASLSVIFPASDYKHLAISRDAFELLKTVRTPNEIKSVKMAFVEDSTAFAKFLYNSSISNEYFSTEYEASVCFENIRKKSQYYISESFPTIFAYKENGAMPHYVPCKETSFQVKGFGLAVFDFGGQYDFGTTDSTRTLLFGNTNKEFKYYYTAILKAHIFLQMCKFDIGIEGLRLDTIVRGLLLKYSIKVPHGIGHGVYMLGNVHDTVPTLSYRIIPPTMFKIVPGMCFTIEPGVYLDKKFGIRIENTVVAKSIGNDEMIFEPLTLCPYEKRLIDVSMLDKDEVNFINAYHKRVFEKIHPRLTGPEVSYLEKLCSPL